MFQTPLPHAIARYCRFRYLIAALTLGVLLVHDVEVRWSQRDTPGADGRESTAAAGVSVASFAHPADRSAEEVARLRADYVARWAPVARAEMRRAGVPASITLAQGLLESVAGTSRLATTTNNHFGIKCFSRTCAPGHCRNFDDDHHKDFFRAYDDPADSYRAHSDFLRGGKRYAGLFDLAPDDYAAWARGLSRAGYATDPAYADKLVSLVERYGLARYDR